MILIAHRGASALATENTSRALDLALRDGAEAVEVDVRLTRDGVPVLAHDDRLDRLGLPGVIVGDATAAELAGMCLLGGEPICTLDAALRWSASGLPLVLELKRILDPERLVRAVGATLDAAPSRVRCVSSFDELTLQLAAAHLPLLARAAIGVTLEGAAAIADRVAAHEVHVEASAARRPAPLPCIAWTIDAQRDLDAAEPWINGFMTNNPAVWRRIAGQNGPRYTAAI